MENTAQNILKKKNGENFSRIIENVPVGIASFSSSFNFEFFNENFVQICNLYQLDCSMILHKSIFDSEFFNDESIKKDIKSIKEGIAFEKEIKNISAPNKTQISLILKGIPLFENDNFNGGILLLEDLKTIRGGSDTQTVKAEQIEKVLNRTSDFIFISSPEGKILYAGGRDIKKLGIKKVSTNDLLIEKIFSPSARSDFKEYLDLVKLKRRSEKLNLELQLEEKKHLYNCRIEPLLNKVGRIQYLFFFFNDITEFINQKQALEKELNELKQYQIITETVTDAVFAVDLNGKIVFWNRAAELLFDFARSEVFGKFFGRVLKVFDDNYFKSVKEELLVKHFWKSRLTVFNRKQEKEIIEAKFSLSGYRNDTIIVLCSNITERAELEKQLRLSEEKFRNIVTESDELICNLDPDGTIIYANPKFIEALNFPESEIIQKNFKDFILPSYMEKNDFKLKLFKENGSKRFELPVVDAEGKTIYLLANFSPIFYDNNVVRYFNGFFTDITDKKNFEKDLLLFRSIFEASQDGIAVEKDDHIVLANNSFTQIFGYSDKEKIQSKNIFNLVSATDITKVKEILTEIKEEKDTSRRVEFLGKREDQSKFYVETSISTFASEGGIYSVLVARDVTERKRTQQAIHDSEEKYRSLIESIDDFMYTFEKIDNTLRPVFYTPSVEKVTGYNQSDLLTDERLIIKMIHPDDFPFIKKRIQSVLRSKIQVSSEFEFRIINKHGNIVWIRNKVTVIRNKRGEILKLYGLVSDITLRKKTEEELKKSTDNLIKLNETKDRFISIISHDLRTPFSSILGFTDLLLKDDELSDADRKQYVEYIQESSNSMLDLVNSLLDWTRLQTGRIKFEPERIPVKGIINGSINALAGTAFQKNITLSSDVHEGIYLYIDKNLIGQVFNNLISNAIKFTPEGGSISIFSNPSESMRFIEFSVKDSGVGIKQENLDKLFRVDSKFTSEGTAGEKGSGLGLSLVKEIIEKHGGRIWVESTVGEGSEFKFTLPVASANILLVDDSKTDRLLYSKILISITPDYNIITASDGKEALEMILKAPPALVITDHLMPGMNGYELVQELKKSNLNVKPPIIVLSSDIDRQVIEEYHELGIEYVFHKPVDLTNFKRSVEKSLRSGLKGI